MSTSIDYSTLAIGALIGVGCRKQIKACAKVAATTAASLASSAALAANTVATQVYESEKTQQPQQPQDNGNGNQEKEMKVQYEMTPDELEYVLRMLMDILSKKNRMHLD